MGETRAQQRSRPAQGQLDTRRAQVTRATKPVFIHSASQSPLHNQTSKPTRYCPRLRSASQAFAFCRRTVMLYHHDFPTC